MDSKIRPFHLAIPVHNLDACTQFYRDTLGCEAGRSSEHWVDFNFFGHQLVIHYKPYVDNALHTNAVDGKAVPIPHFGIILDWNTFNALAEKLQTLNVSFIIEPYVRFEGEIGEQATMFFYDPSGNALEFKAFKDFSQLFAK